MYKEQNTKFLLRLLVLEYTVLSVLLFFSQPMALRMLDVHVVDALYLYGQTYV